MTSSKLECENCKFKLIVQAVLMGVLLVACGLLTWAKILDVSLFAVVTGGVMAFSGVAGYNASQGMKGGTK